MGHGFILTDQDAAPEGATYVEDFIELSLLTMGEAKPPVDLTWINEPQDY